MDERKRYTDDPTLRRMQTENFSVSRSRPDGHRTPSRFWDTVLVKDPTSSHPHPHSNSSHSHSLSNPHSHSHSNNHPNVHSHSHNSGSTTTSSLLGGSSAYPRMDSASLRHYSSQSFHHTPSSNAGGADVHMAGLMGGHDHVHGRGLGASSASHSNNSAASNLSSNLGGRRKDFQCHNCKVAFSQKSHLTQHIKTVHEKIRPYKCEYCTRAFGKRYDLISHIDAVHKKERPHACSFCDKQFAKRSNLTRHIEHMHPDAKPRKNI